MLSPFNGEGVWHTPCLIGCCDDELRWSKCYHTDHVLDYVHGIIHIIQLTLFHDFVKCRQFTNKIDIH